MEGMLRKGFLLPKQQEVEEPEKADRAICKNCKVEFDRLLNHLSKKSQCKAVYTEDEIETIKKIGKTARRKKYNDNNREQNKQKQAEYNQAHKEDIAKKQKERREKKKENWTAEDRINAFKKSTEWGWSFVCSSCNRKFWQDQVLDLKPEVQHHLLDMMKISTLKQLCNHSQLWKHEGKCKHICRTCYPYLRNYITDLEPCLQDGTCRRPTIWWADGQEEPTEEELPSPLDFLLEAWEKGWDEEIVTIQSTVRTMIDHDLTQKDIISDCLPDCSEDGMCGICMFDRVYYCVSMEHCTTECPTLVEKSRRTSRLQDVIEFIDLMKKNNHLLTDSD